MNGKTFSWMIEENGTVQGSQNCHVIDTKQNGTQKHNALSFIQLFQTREQSFGSDTFCLQNRDQTVLD